MAQSYEHDSRVIRLESSNLLHKKDIGGVRCLGLIRNQPLRGLVYSLVRSLELSPWFFLPGSSDKEDEKQRAQPRNDQGPRVVAFCLCWRRLESSPFCRDADGEPFQSDICLHILLHFTQPLVKPEAPVALYIYIYITIYTHQNESIPDSGPTS